MKSLKLVCYASLIFAIVPAAHAKPVQKRPASKARPAAAPSIARTLQGFYNRSNAAANRLDLDGAMRYYSQDFKVIDPQKNEYDLGEIRYRLSALFDSAKSIKGVTTVASATQRGNTATALIREVVQGVIIDPNTGRRSTFTERQVSRDTWTHTDDGWMCTASQQISDTATLNGRAVTAPKSDQDSASGDVNATPAFGAILGNQ
ncbi:MAG: hypothetical protein ABIY70_28145 [Capsulimonas sp.]|uniref:hypothetical protein n=1 Tax=Capsulimonas sp. TaxID=2494211 RepID=UPI0032644971